MPVTDQEKAAKARDAALQGALTQIEREFGKGTVMRMGDEGAQVRCDAIPTGALSLDLALGIGGVPRGRIVEVFGPESSGKTTMIYHVLAEAQKLGGVCAFIDAEHAMDPLYAREIGVDIDELLVSQPDYGEQALEIADMLVRSGRGGRRGDRLGRGADAEGRARGADGRPDGRRAGAHDVPGDAQARRQPEPHADAVHPHQPDPRKGRRDVRLARDPAGRSCAEVLRLPAPRHPAHRDAQGRHRGGRQPRAREGRQEQGGSARSARPSSTSSSARASPPSGCLIDLGLEHNIVSKSGSFFSYGNDRLGQGRGNAKAYLDENPEMAKEIEDKIYAALGLGKDLVTPIDRDKEADERPPIVSEPAVAAA